VMLDITAKLAMARMQPLFTPGRSSCSAALSLRMICSAVCLVRFMEKIPTQPGRLRVLIHSGVISMVHVNETKEPTCRDLKGQPMIKAALMVSPASQLTAG